MKKNNFKKETYQEYVARGGKVTKLPPIGTKSTTTAMRVKSSGASSIMSWEDGDLFYGEKLTRKKSKKVDQKEIDKLLTFLPEEMRRKIGF